MIITSLLRGVHAIFLFLYSIPYKSKFWNLHKVHHPHARKQHANKLLTEWQQMMVIFMSLLFRRKAKIINLAALN